MSNTDPILPASACSSSTTDEPDAAWQDYMQDPVLKTSAEPGTTGNVPPGEDLNLHIGWDRFEKLLLAVCRSGLGLHRIRFRRYGVQGQSQHGIDLAGRGPDGTTVVQCKDYQQFTPAVLRAAVEKFATGRRPFGAKHLIIATSGSTEATQFADELDALENEHPDLDLELWGSEQINERLRSLGNVVARFWTRETAESFCTDAPPAGIPVPLPDRVEQAEKILIGPLKTSAVSPLLRQAEEQLATAPEVSARLYADLARQLEEAGFLGHAIVLRRRQLDALQAARLFDETARLAAQLAVNAIHAGETSEPRTLAGQLERVATEADEAGSEAAPLIRRHAALVRAALEVVAHPLGPCEALRTALEDTTETEPEYRPVLVLLLAEHTLVWAPERLPALDKLIRGAIEQQRTLGPEAQDTLMRLRLVRAEYDPAERTELQRLARRHQLPGRLAAWVNAREARRCVWESIADTALDHWRDAVEDAIHAGLAEDAADWLYAIRAVNTLFGPWADLDDEHRLAQALRGTGTGRLLVRAREPRDCALSAKGNAKPIEAVLSGRRWLVDATVAGDLGGELEALDFLGDLYAANQEPRLAVRLYGRAGRKEKLQALAAVMGDHPLPSTPIGDAPWWVLHADAALAQAQADLIDDDVARELMGAVTSLAERGRAGELTESPTRALTHQATKTACSLAGRGTPEQALKLLDLLAADVPREPHHFHHSDQGHAQACVAIAKAHPSAAKQALTRLFDLAEAGVQEALQLLIGDELIGLIRTLEGEAPQASESGLSDEAIAELRNRIGDLDDRGLYLADVARALFEPAHPKAVLRAEQARDRILQRPAPTPGIAQIGSALVPDSYQVARAHGLNDDDRKACLEQLLAIASDGREVVLTRQQALTAAGNLVVGRPQPDRRYAFKAVTSLVVGDEPASYLGEVLTDSPHPLSAFRVNIGSASLRGPALKFAAAASYSSDEYAWVRDQATELLGSRDEHDVHEAAAALCRLPNDIAGIVDPGLLATHDHFGVRQASAVLCMRFPARHYKTALNLARDPDFRVRRALVEAAANAAVEGPEIDAIRQILRGDPRHSIRSRAGVRRTTSDRAGAPGQTPA
ncbi:restriction endonuclease [Streptomyces gilvosporeus]|uniref:restriction endonuclease n=1 Tax=Streptomyces gilvosporeus TaxID=553510 RepID=UPI001F357693|nr:restriction endonuclease [Streptomyces gilvosporeus]